MVDDDQSKVARIALRRPGRLLTLGLEELKKYVQARGGREGDEVLPAQVVRYLTSVFHSAHSPESIGPGKTRELRTLAECIDHLCEGRLDACGDTLMQRFTAVELSVTEGSWHQAKHLELIPDNICGLAGRGLRAAAVKEETRELKLKELISKRGGKKPGS